MHPVVIAVYLHSNPQQHGNSSIGGSPMSVIERFSIMPSWKDDGQTGSAALSQAKNEGDRLVCANVFGLWVESKVSWP